MPEPDYRILSLLSPEQAHSFRAIPISAHGNSILFWGDAQSRQFVPQLRMILGKTIGFEEIESAELERLLLQHYPYQKENGHARSSEMASYEESDVVRFVNKMMEEAAKMNASDIHIERYEAEARIRFRWEGHLVEKYEVPLDQYNAIISRIKILAELDISERRLPQDGRINIQLKGQAIDIRVSTVPGKYGEKAVLRLLTRSQEHLQLGNLGLGDVMLSHYEKAIRKPNGIVLITGPTGSGKTTTLYATLNLLNQPEKNIMTVEDPIEYNLSGINQIQVKEEIGLSFDSCLRAFLRQDPDIIMVGEIRDLPTAQIAIRAALTGHLVFSTLHTNSSWDAITRLADMGIEPYLVAASLRIVVAQRLVRKLCPHCKQTSEEQLFPEIQNQLGIHSHAQPRGCSECYYTGYLGRRAVFEVLPVTADLKRQIKSGEGELTQIFAEAGLPSLRDNLSELVKAEITSLEEALSHLEA